MQKTARNFLSSAHSLNSAAVRAANASQKRYQKMCRTITIVGVLVPLMFSMAVASSNLDAPRRASAIAHIKALASKHIETKHIDGKHIDNLAGKHIKAKHIDGKHIDGKHIDTLANRHIKVLAGDCI